VGEQADTRPVGRSCIDSIIERDDYQADQRALNRAPPAAAWYDNGRARVGQNPLDRLPELAADLIRRQAGVLTAGEPPLRHAQPTRRSGGLD
jgi:hypothetical protein